MHRRDFIKAVAGSVAGWPLAVRAQQAGKQPTIGFLGSNESSWSSWTAAFVQRMRELGWIKRVAEQFVAFFPIQNTRPCCFLGKIATRARCSAFRPPLATS
jgi:hypothetical protein